MASQTQGIQQLLAAEKKAAEKVSDARKRKANRLKQAKKEAEVEIIAYKTERERQYKEYEAKVLGSRGDMEQRIETNTKQKIHEIGESVKRNKEVALTSLLNVVYEIKPELHENLKL
ncbi:hypothetical protein LOTGIDRAFT_220690 [Lottia gigantea]|uniref:V-type proton ATPase subunit G n=1 Tax=Lottia gigantea TaxID=225164 RepID=V3ZPW7_LOTGI|nr:hypothetical protein LOTGIDRAFT_220690 [Lottia gigantea]ESO86372.1 hypothetical protein LOTGIDRAFT_220690 [Lottia gigantea]